MSEIRYKKYLPLNGRLQLEFVIDLMRKKLKVKNLK